MASWHQGIAEHGWLVISVPDGDQGPFHYTAGLTGHDLPEMIVYGLPQGTGHALLNDLARRFLEGERVDDGVDIPDLVKGGLRLQLWTATRLVDPLGAVVAIYGDEQIKVRQLVIPDPGNRLPWETGYEHEPRQPMLFAIP